MIRVTAAALSVLALCAACRSGGGEAGSFTVRDSAGVRIAESTAPAWKEDGGWTLSEDPVVEVGVVEGDPRYQFNWVASGVLLRDGGFGILDASSTLRAFSGRGTFVWSAGRQGDGPGEFRRATSVKLLDGDSLLVFDAGTARLSVFTKDGAFVRSAKLEPPPEALYGMRDVFPALDGTLVITTGGSTGLLGGSVSEGLQREQDPVLRFARDGGGPLGTIGVFPGMEWYATKGGIGPPPFAHKVSFAIRDTTLIVGTSEEMSLQVRSLDGELLEIVRVPGVDLTVTDADGQAYRALMMSRVPQDEALRKTVLDRLDAVPDPAKKAAYSKVVADADGNLWVAELPVGTPAPTRWTVFSPEGRLLGDVAVPGETFQVLDIGSDALLGVWMDDLDVQHVGLYAIRR